MNNKEAIVVLKSHLHHWECLLKSKICTNKEGEETIDALELAIKALEKVDDPRNDPHYAECNYCQHLELSSNDYPCCECGSAEEFKNKWERR
jgi:hypothetical protein